MYLAVDIGATKTLIAAMNARGEILETLKFPTAQLYEDLIRDTGEHVVQLNHRNFTRAIIAVPGRLDRDKGVALAFGNRPWENVPIVKDAQAVIGCPVIIENDAKLAALSEAILVKHKFTRVLYITISTGISAGLIVDGKIDPALADSESGHMRFEIEGHLEKWQDFASGKAIVAKYGKRASEITDPKAWREIAHNIALGITELIAVIQPEVIILGGGVGTHYAKFEKQLLAELSHFDMPMTPVPPIQIAKHPEEAVIYGCYQLAKQTS